MVYPTEPVSGLTIRQDAQLPKIARFQAWNRQWRDKLTSDQVKEIVMACGFIVWTWNWQRAKDIAEDEPFHHPVAITIWGGLVGLAGVICLPINLVYRSVLMGYRFAYRLLFGEFPR